MQIAILKRELQKANKKKKEEEVKQVELQSFVIDSSKKKYEVLAIEKSSIFSIIQAINQKGYFSHLSALYINKLVAEPEVNYFNIEHAKPSKRFELNQQSVDKAFSKPARLSSNKYTLSNKALFIINGLFTDKIGVLKVSADTDYYQYTDIERTLIDISVRPQYAGGQDSVIDAYKQAKTKVDLNKLRSYLDQINYVYPYEQVIGYYLDKAGYSISDQNLFYTLNRYKLRFYLVHGMKSPKYNAKWNLYEPN